jgi:large subunit ribosomal protein L29
MAKNPEMKIDDVRQKTPDELKQMLIDLRREQFNLRFQRATGQMEGTARIRSARREVARVKTVMAERRRGSAHASQG